MSFIVDIISIFPEIFAPVLKIGMTGRAIARGLLTVHITDPRNYTLDKHRSTDDTPYGGGSGMVMCIEPLVRSLTAIAAARGRGHRVMLTPTGERLTQHVVRRLAQQAHLVLLCGRYEGVDERVCGYVDEEISLGDFILTGGELAALAAVDAVTRLYPGVLHNASSTAEESFENDLLEYPHYTRPATFDDASVPAVLLSGNHEQIRRWRRQQSLLRTRARRPDLFARLVLAEEDRELLATADRVAEHELSAAGR